jgi:outer membrane protein assembly factor BamB
MNRLLVVFLTVVLTSSHTFVSAGELMTPDAMSRLGLAQAWARPVHVPAGAQSIRDQQLFVHEKAPHEYVIITAPKPAPPVDAAATANQDAAKPTEASEPETITLARIPTDRIGINGAPIGRAEAERLASNEIRRLKRRGVDAEMKIITSPRVNLYTIGSDGLLECRNAETGEPIWIQRVGKPSLPFSDLGVSEKYITVVNGGNLIQVEAENGQIIREVRTQGAPAFGALNSGDFAVVPLIGGGVEGYSLYDPERVPFRERVTGTTLAMPTKAPNSSKTAWGTSKGFVYVMELQGKPTVQFRLDTDGIVSGRIASASGNRFFFGSETGQVYGLRATRIGEVLWSQPFAEPFYNQPLVYEDQVLIRSSYGNLFSLNVENGLQTWNGSKPNIGELLGVLDNRIYATTMSGGLVVLDVKTGQKLATFNNIRPEYFIVNDLTDRLYLVSNDGDVQCIRSEGANLPTLVSHTEPKKSTRAATIETDPTQAPAQGGGNDPFGAAKTDPFGAGGGGGGNADPFGGGGGGGGNADPFGGGGGGGNADPFGGGGGDEGMADPFGGSPF